MSDQGRAHVLDHSPYTGSTFFVHYFLGDKANADNDYQLWLSMSKLARNLRMGERTVHRSIAELVSDGHLELIEERKGKPHIYRFVFVRADDASYTPGGVIQPGSLLKRLPDDQF